jgi:hypothetical protein
MTINMPVISKATIKTALTWTASLAPINFMIPQVNNPKLAKMDMAAIHR